MAETCRELQALGHEGSVAGSGVLVERLGGEFDRICKALDLEASKIQGTARPNDQVEAG